MKIKDRIKDFRRVKASELRPNPKNWRTHPQEQVDAMKGILAEVGFAGASIAFETEDGLMLLDGHLRAEIAPNAEVPVLILDVTPEEANKILATHDAVTGMAEVDRDSLGALLQGMQFESESVNELISELCDENSIDLFADGVSQGDHDWEAEWQGMPEFDNEDLSAFKSIIVHFRSEENLQDFCEKIGQKVTEKTKSIWHPEEQREDLKSKVYMDDDQE